MVTVPAPKALGYQCLDWLAQEILARVLEEPLRLRVEDDHVAFTVDDDDRVGCRFEEASKPLLDFPTCRGVSDDADDERPRLGLQRAQADFDGELAAIFAAPPKLSAFPHGAGVGLARVVVAVPGVLLPEPLRNHPLDRHGEQLLTGVTEQAFGELVDDDDVA
jgi:hypothetical protein